MMTIIISPLSIVNFLKEYKLPIRKALYVSKEKRFLTYLNAKTEEKVLYALPNPLKTDLSNFCKSVKEELPNADFFKAIGLPNISGEQLVKLMEEVFGLDS